MIENKWHLLQLFSEGGEGSATGAGAAAVSNTGVSDAAAGHQRLRELGVPENKIRKNRVYNLPKTENAPVEAEPVAEQDQVEEQAAAAEKPTEESKRMTWDEIKADPEYSEHLNKMMRERTRKSRAAVDAMEYLTPAVEALAKVYGMDMKNIDYAALAEKIQGDDRLYEDKGLEMGVDASVARKVDQFDILASRQKEQQNTAIQDRAMQEHYTNLVQQGETLKKTFPGFNLQQELKNPIFARMTAPGTGVMSVEDAYRAVHRKEIEAAALKAAADQTAKNMANAVRSGTMRPQENGSSTTAPSVSTFDYRTASKEQREALKQRIRMAGARGEKIYPGQ